LTDAIPGIEAAAASVEPELGIFIGKDLGLAGPEGMRHLETVGGVGGAELTGLDEEGEESRDEKEQENGTCGSEMAH